jgi:hypothetical protein
VPQTRGHGRNGRAGCQQVGCVGMAQQMERTAFGLGNSEANEKLADGARQ